VDGLVDNGLVTKHYRHQTNDKKYPVMREMFWDPAHPITTNWVVWFDDDSIADRNRQWVYLLLQKIIDAKAGGAGLVGPKFFWDLKPGQAEHYKSRPWYRGRAFCDRHGKESPNGTKIVFAAGGFWAMATEALRAADVPDPALGHNGGDYTIGAQLWQHGYSVASWNSNKQFVHTSSVPRRGLSEPHFGVKATKKPERTIVIQ
jgi:GT2 family glycosyltransferase